jgi:Membrane bound beta barrel domain (DUF5777)
VALSFGVMKHLEAVFYRTSFARTIQLYAKYDAIHPRRGPFALSALVSVEGANNFKEQYSPSLGAVLSHTIADTAALYVTPVWVHNSAPALDVTRDTFFAGVGGRVRVRPTVYAVAEVSPRLAGYSPGKPEFAFGIEKRAGLHMFQLNFTNTQQSTLGQMARGGFPHTLYLGFNLARKFY